MIPKVKDTKDQEHHIDLHCELDSRSSSFPTRVPITLHCRCLSGQRLLSSTREHRYCSFSAWWRWPKEHQNPRKASSNYLQAWRLIIFIMSRVHYKKQHWFASPKNIESNDHSSRILQFLVFPTKNTNCIWTRGEHFYTSVCLDCRTICDCLQQLLILWFILFICARVAY